MTIFLVFRIGYKLDNPEEMESELVMESNSYQVYKSDILKGIKKGEKRTIKAFFEKEFHFSYEMLESRYL